MSEQFEEDLSDLQEERVIIPGDRLLYWMQHNCSDSEIQGFITLTLTTAANRLGLRGRRVIAIRNGLELAVHKTREIIFLLEHVPYAPLKTIEEQNG